MGSRYNDTYGDTDETATPFAIGDTKHGWAAGYSYGFQNYDYFVFQGEKNAEYTISLTNNGVDWSGPGSDDTYFPLSLSLYKDNGDPDPIWNTTLISRDKGNYGDRDHEIVYTADFTGPVYVSVAKTTTISVDVPYTLKIAETTPAPPPDPLPAVNAPAANSPLATIFSKDSNGKALRVEDRIIKYFLDDGVGNGGALSDSPWNTTEKTAVKAAMTQISKYVDLTFEEITNSDDVGDADWVFIIKDNGAPGKQGAFTHPGDGRQFGEFFRSGSGWDENDEGGLDKGGAGFSTLVHEMLHGLGLAHPHDNGGNSKILPGSKSGDSLTPGQNDLNQGVFTAMSYVPGWYDGEVPRAADQTYGDIISPMALDLAVLQLLYGKKANVAKGDTLYKLQGITDDDTSYQLIYDTGGTDTIRTADNANGYVDLRAATLKYESGGGGRVSYMEDVTGGFTIAKGVVIENAEGSIMDDTLGGNDHANKLMGKGGQDKLFGRGGKDTLEGGSGWDTLYGQDGNDTLRGGDGNDKMYGGANNNLLVGDDGNDTLYGAEHKDTLKGGIGKDQLFGYAHDDHLFGGANNDTLKGGHNTDKLSGDGGNDKLFGGAHMDNLKGGADNDTLQGDGGDDRLIGNDGVDTAVFAGKIGKFDIKKVGNKIKVIDKSGKLGTDTLSSIEKLQFGNKVYKVKQALKASMDKPFNKPVEEISKTAKAFAVDDGPQDLQPQLAFADLLTADDLFV